MTAPEAKRFPWMLALVSLAALAVLLSLGTWQVQRLYWKRDLVVTIEARIDGPPRPLAEVEREHRAGDIDYHPVEVSGRFHHEGERHLLATYEGQSGWHVYTPLQLDDGRYLFVNRGFVPYELKDPARRPEGQVAGEVRIKGLARTALAEKPSFIVPDNNPGSNQFYWKELPAMAASAGLPPVAQVLPFLVDADATSMPGDWPRGGVTIVNLPDNHLQYAVTWYGLALVLAVMAAIGFLRHLRAGRDLDSNRG